MAFVTAHAAEPVAKVSVFTTGEVLLNGKPTTLHALDAALAQLSQTGGAVWYYRQGAESEPPSQAMEVMQLVVKHRLPISMSTKPDFSDTVDANGNSVPREP